MPEVRRSCELEQRGVLDRETGLVWQQNPQDFKLSWVEAQQSAIDGCITATTGGRNGWRLPTLEELQSLSDGSRTARLPPGHPFGANADGDFWTATTSLFTPNDAVAWGTTNFGGLPKRRRSSSGVFGARLTFADHRPSGRVTT